MPGKPKAAARDVAPPQRGYASAKHVPDRSILTKSIANAKDDEGSKKTAKKGVGFDPSLPDLGHEDSTTKSHSVQSKETDKKQQEIDLSGEHGKRIFCRNLELSLFPLSILLRLVGRFPFSQKKSKDHKTYEYTSHFTSLGVFHFHLTTAFLFYALITGLVSILLYTLKDVSSIRKSLLSENRSDNEITYKTKLLYNQALIQRNAIPLIIVFTTLIQACISSILFTRRRNYMAHIFSFISKAAYTLHMNLAEKTKNFSVQSTVLFMVVMCAFILMSCLKFGPSSIGTPTTFGSMMISIFLGFKDNRVWLDPDNPLLFVLPAVGGFFLVMIFVTAFAPILLFIYKCKIIRNAFAFWNGRAYCALLRGMEHAQTVEARTTYTLLFKDHCTLLDLLSSIDQMYAFIIELFFGIQAISLCFQMYFGFRTGSQTLLTNQLRPMRHSINSVNYMRPYDVVPVFLLLFANSVILYSAGRAATKVSEEAAAGLEVIRRKGVIGRRSDQELEFMHSMNFSFQCYRQIKITGAGYFYYNRGFLILMLAVILFCFLLLCQYRPLLDLSPGRTNNETADEVKVVARFIRRIEGTVDHHNMWANPSDDREWAIGY